MLRGDWICIDGNISSGKSTLAQSVLQELGPQRILLGPEATNDWTNFFSYNVLEKVKSKSAADFFAAQTVIQQSQFNTILACFEQDPLHKKIKIIERGLSSGLFVFAKAALENSIIDKFHFLCLEYLYDNLINHLKKTNKQYIFIHTDPTICVQRTQNKLQAHPHDQLAFLNSLDRLYSLYFSYQKPLLELNGSNSIQSNSDHICRVLNKYYP